MAHGVWSVVCGVWCVCCMECGVWCVVYGVWCGQVQYIQYCCTEGSTMRQYGPWCVVYGVWCMVGEQERLEVLP